MKDSTKFAVALASALAAQAAAAQCDVTLPPAQYVTCLSLQHQQQTGTYPHPSQFQVPVYRPPTSTYQQSVPTYQAPTPAYQSPQTIYQQPTQVVPWVPADRSSSYR